MASALAFAVLAGIDAYRGGAWVIHHEARPYAYTENIFLVFAARSAFAMLGAVLFRLMSVRATARNAG